MPGDARKQQHQNHIHVPDKGNPSVIDITTLTIMTIDLIAHSNCGLYGKCPFLTFDYFSFKVGRIRLDSV